jgi:PAS domain S-box-containing protein
MRADRTDDVLRLRRKSGSVLIVEDDSEISTFLGVVLHRLGFHVAGVAASHEEAMERFAMHPPDIVIMDIGLRGEMDGIQTAEKMRTVADVPIIYVTGYTDQHTFERAACTAPYGFILKPFTTGDVERATTLALQRHAFDRVYFRSHERHSAIFNNITDAILIYGPDGRLRLCNRRASELTGIPVEELIRHPCDEIPWNTCDADGDHLPSKDFPIVRAFREGEAVQQCVVGFPDFVNARTRWISLSVVPQKAVVRDEEELLCVLTDITPLKASGVELRARIDERTREFERSEARYRGFTDSRHEYVLRLTSEAGISFANEALRDLLGGGPEASLGALHVSADSELRTLADEVSQLLAHTDGRAELLSMLRTPSGPRWIQWECVYLAPDGSAPPEIQVIGRDITLLKQQLERNTIFHRALMRTREAIAILDAEYRFSFVNPAFIRLFGLAESCVLGSSTALLGRNFSPTALHGLLSTSTDGWDGEIAFSSRTLGSGYLAVSFSPISDEHGSPPGFILMCRDVSDSRKKDVNSLEEELFASIGRMAGSLAHEMKSPITAALMKLEMLRNEMCNDLKDIRAFESIEKEVRRLHDIVRSSLDITAIGRLHLQPLPLHTLLDELCESMAPLLSKHDVDFSTDIPRLTVLGDPARLLVVLRNLLTNAVEAGPHGGSVSIQARGNEGAGVAEIFVEDSGTGVEDRERCFRSFYTTKKWGSGLGLPTARRIAEAHGGSLDLHSTGPNGSVFVLTIPLADVSDLIESGRDG